MKLGAPRHLDEHGMTPEQIEQTQRKYGVGPFLTVDMVILTVKWTESAAQPLVLVIERKNHPYQGWFALPGGFVDLEEDLEDAARRELQEETGVSFGRDALVDQLRTFGFPRRDPRGRNISVAHLAIVPWASLPTPEAGDDAAQTAWLPLRDGALWTQDKRQQVSLAFDHEQIIDVAWRRVEHLAEHAFALATLLPTPFTDSHVRSLYAALSQRRATPKNVSDLLERGWAQRDGASGVTLKRPADPWR